MDEPGGEQHRRSHRVVRAQAEHRPHRALFARTQEETGVHEGHNEVPDPEGHARGAEGVRDGQSGHEKAGHAHEHQQLEHGLARRNGVGEPRVPAVHPPDVAEDEHHPADTGARGLGHQQRGELRDREDEHEVEEELDRRDPYVVYVVHGPSPQASGPVEGDQPGQLP